MRAQHTLFGESIRNRPRRHDAETLDLATELVVADLWNAFRNDLNLDEAAREDVREVIEFDGDDGYRFARALERKGWDVDASMVEVLNSCRISDALDKRIAAWVAKEGIVPLFKVGDHVPLRIDEHIGRPPDWTGEDTVDGEIIRIDEVHGDYIVRVAAFGHPETTGYVMHYERIEPDDGKTQRQTTGT